MLFNHVFAKKYIVKLCSLLLRDEQSCWIVQSVIGVNEVLIGFSILLVSLHGHLRGLCRNENCFALFGG